MGVTTPTTSSSHSLPSSPLRFSFDPELLTPPEPEEVGEGFISSGAVRKSRLLGMRKGIGFRNVPPFRKRVVSLPPVPIVTQNGLLERRGTEKQVRFYTNVICHEYQSY